MKNLVKVLLIFLYFFMTNSLFANDWQEATKVDIPFSINSVDMLEDGFTGWAVCNDALVLKTTDGWKSWEFHSCSEDADFDLFDVDFIDANYGWVVGGGRKKPTAILFSRDGGKNWEKQSFDILYQINTIAAVDSNHAWCAGNDGIIYKTEDHNKWEPCEITNETKINGIHLSGFKNGVAVGDDQKIFFTNNGQTWTEITKIPNINNEDLNAVWMTDENQVWAVGDAPDDSTVCLLKSADGGKSWQIVELDAIFTEDLKSIKFDFRGKGIAAGEKGFVLVSEDGSNWRQLERQFANKSEDIAISDNKIWSFGGMGIIQYSDNFGQDWDLIPKTTSQSLFKITAIDESTIMAVGYYSAIMKSDDAGATWHSDCVIADNDFCLRLGGIDFANDKTGWVCGARGFLAKTTNGGETWEKQISPEFNSRDWLNDVEVIDENTMWCCGRKGLLVSSNRGGDQLTRYNSQLNVFLNDIEFLDTVSGITVGNGVILHTNNAGASWNPAEYDSVNVPNLVCCQIIAPDFSIALSSDGQLLHSADLGKHWTYRATIGEGNFTSITFADRENGWATNSSGSIFSSDNSGYKWEEEFTIDNGLFSLTRNESRIFACGLGGTVLTTSIDTNLEELHEDELKHPQHFVLYQNYPNPFNSATSIVYQLKREQHVSLDLYNTVGQKIAILVNEFKSPGTHIHHLSFKNRSSGIYYIKMRAGDFVSTKRLVHIK